MKNITNLGISPWPWKIIDTPVTLNSCCDGYEGGSMVIRSLSATIADLACEIDYDQHKEEITANARLIAAAPDCYDALQRIVSATEGAVMDFPKWKKDLQKALDDAKKAIEKAGGGNEKLSL